MSTMPQHARNEYQLSQMDPRDALPLARRTNVDAQCDKLHDQATNQYNER